MLAIGRALMAKPKLFLMDEPSLELAPSIVQELSSITKSINESGISILLVEQNISLAFRVASKGYVMELGNIILQGEMEKLRTNE
jgi:branched-chain amino acid transport system ATP-binding protein